MISVILLSPSLGAATPAPRAAEALARTLGALVRATMEGLVRDAVLIGPAADDLTTLADHAGCAHVETDSAKEGLLRALEATRGDIVFVLEGGYAPPGGFIEEAGDLLLEGELFTGALLRRSPHSLPTRLAPGLARAVGLLARRRDVAGARARDLPELIRRIKPRRSLRIRAVRMV